MKMDLLSGLALFLEDSANSPITEDDVTSKLIPNLWAFLTQLLAFGVLVFLIIKFAYKPVHKFLQKRQEFVQSNLDTAQKNAADAQKANAEAQARLASSRKEADGILIAAKRQAEENSEEYKAELDKELRLKRAQAEEDIELKKRQSVKEAQDEMVDIALQASSSLLGREVTDDDNKKYVARFIQDASEKDNEKR